MLREQLVQLTKRKAESKVKVRFAPDLTPDQVLDHYANQSDVHDYLCAAPWTRLNIAATGEVFPCFNYRIGKRAPRATHEVVEQRKVS